jgi:hypothetical protein
MGNRVVGSSCGAIDISIPSKGWTPDTDNIEKYTGITKYY